jgi:hypothetical protein
MEENKKALQDDSDNLKALLKKCDDERSSRLKDLELELKLYEERNVEMQKNEDEIQVCALQSSLT